MFSGNMVHLFTPVTKYLRSRWTEKAVLISPELSVQTWFGTILELVLTM